MKLSLAFLALSGSFASAYRVGGFDPFGRPYFVSPRGLYRRASPGPRNGCASPQGQVGCDVDRAFEELRKEMNNDRFRRPNKAAMPRGFEVDEDTIRRGEEWVNRAIGLASDLAKDLASTPQEAKQAEEALREQRELADRAFEFARDVSSGGTYPSVRSRVIQDDDRIFQVELEVPGVKAADIDVSVEGTKDKILVVRGERKVGGEEAPRKFSKSIYLNRKSDIEAMSANLENGVLVVTVPRKTIENTESIQKISVNKLSDEAKSSSEETGAFRFEVELDVPGVSAPNIDITVEGDTDKILTITAVRELGKDSEGKPRKRELSKSYKIDEVIDTSKIVANLSDGVLKVSAPADEKKAKETVRKILVNQPSQVTNGSSLKVESVDDEQRDDPALEEKEGS